MDLKLQGARVLVAASSAGLGAATARQFSLEGARVVINGRDAAKLNARADAIRAESGGDVFAVPGDMSQADQAVALVDQAVQHLGGLDVLVTNAGGPPPGMFDDVTPEGWQAAFELVMMSTVHLIRTALPHLRQSDRAAVLTVTSSSVKQPISNLLLSNTLRMSVIGLTKSLANELGPQGIRVNSILPGFTYTDRVESLLKGRAESQGISVQEAAERQAANMPLGRIGDPAEFGNVAVFLCSPAASFVTGVMVPVDGGSVQFPL